MKINKKEIFIKLTASFFAFIVFSIFTLTGLLRFIDLPAGAFLTNLNSPGFGYIFYLFRSLAHFNISLMLLVFISLFAYLAKFKKLAYFFLIIFFVINFSGSAIKNYAKRQRPIKEAYELSYDNFVSDARKNSYPSGHTLRIAYLLMALSAVFSSKKFKKWIRVTVKSLLYFVIAMVGISSVALGAHWLTDVIASCIMSYFFCLILILISSYNPLARTKA